MERIEYYTQRVAEAEAKVEELKDTNLRLGLLRLGILIGGLILTYLFFLSGVVLGIMFLLITAALFSWVVMQHQRSQRLQRNWEIKGVLNNNEIDCLQNHQNTYYNGIDFDDDKHFYSNDLDLFGDRSIFGLVNRGRSFIGVNSLAGFFKDLPTLMEVNRQQKAVMELSDEIDWRQNFHTELFDLNADHQNDLSTKIEELMDSDLSFADQPLLKYYRIALPLIWIVIAIVYFYYSQTGYIMAVLAGVLNFGISSRYALRVSEIQNKISKAGTTLGQYDWCLKGIFSRKWKAPLLEESIQKLEVVGRSGPKSLVNLRKIIDLLDYRLNMVVSAVLNIGFLWDTHIISRLAKWTNKNNKSIRYLFETIGLFEAISSLANWAFNHPDFSYPTVDDAHFHIEMKSATHPLMKLEDCVANDFVSKQPDYITVITGSNMSGKSTFLRTVGTNMVLGNAGTTVAASQMSYSLTQLVSYMRIKDALEENVSTFKAELNRVQLILEMVKNNEQCLILIDEMLRGTNSKDKLKGSIAITQELLSAKAYAMIATHDIKLAEMGNEYGAHFKNYYFDIEFKKDELQFDYKLKPGICNSFNASFLLEKLGLKMDT